MKSQQPFIVLALACCFIFSFTEGQVSQVFVTTTGSFTRFLNATGGGSTVKYCGGDSQAVCIYNTPPSRQVRWGTPYSSSNSLKSGLGFEGVSNLVNLNQEFYIGQLSHFNYQIETGSAATSADLNIQVVVQDAASNITIGSSVFSYTFKINETVNTPPCAFPPQSVPCSDEITFANSGFTTGSFQIGQVTYTVQLTGFKESQSSTSYSNPGFISQEDTQSNGYLFARITVACPNICVGGGQYIITSDNRCICDCSTLPACPGSQVFSNNCTCQCPNPNLCLNGGVLNPTSCTCNCPACPFPKILNPVNCDCPCNATYCGNGLIANQSTCACSCPQTVCGPNFDISPTCGCACNLNCSAQTPPKIRVNDTNICNCVCANSTCSPGYQIDNSNCQCRCIRTCPNGQPLNSTTCTCGNCVGNWVKDDNGLCTKCNLTQSDCGGSAALNLQSCSCNCNNSTLCDPLKGEVIDTSQFCACRACGTQPGDVCYCGNGIVEPGEDCDYITNGTINPCCVNCKFTVNTCNDLNLCTDNDRCNGNGTCIGFYKCPASDDCRDISCVNTVGVCNIVHKNNGTSCGDGNLCQRRCLSGVCTTDPETYGSCSGLPDDPVDCFGWQCVPSSGNCIQITLNETTCSDSDPCTVSDTCYEGVCLGQPLVCAQSNKPCKISVCNDGTCQQYDLSDAPCNADNNNCSPDDRCYGGVCIRGTQKVCQTNNPCLIASCSGASGECNLRFRNSIPCDDLNLCTTNDTCYNGTCFGVPDPATIDLVECGADKSSGGDVGQTSLIIFTVAGAAAIISALIGGAFLIKKIRDSRLLDPETWNPDTFNSVEINPTYKGLEKAFVNPLHDAQ